MKRKYYIILIIVIVIVVLYFGKLRYLSVDKKYGDTLRKLHKKARPKFREFLRRIINLGYDVIITSSYRTFAKQQQLKNENPKNASPGLSFHNYGMAIDINLKKGNTYWRKADSTDKWLKSGVPQIAQKLGLRWGGTFKGYHDPIHFDMGEKYDTRILLKDAIAQFGQNAAKIEGNKVKV